MSQTDCGKLWDHQYVHMSGSMRLCCATNDDILDSKGQKVHINNNSLENVWNSKHMRDIRLKMIKGEKISSCAKCVSQESRGFQSMRKTIDKEKNFAMTNDDGSVDIFPSEMELHFGNICNLKCKMCGQQYSNQIGKELLEIGQHEKGFIEWLKKESGNVNIWTNNLSVEYKWFQNKKIKNKLFKYIASNIKQMTVIGGEPTIIPEFWELFEYLDNHGKLKDLHITLTTNLTNVNPKMTSWLPKLKSWSIWASIDGLGKRTEYIRYPSNFDKICDNLNFYKKLISNDKGQIVLSPAIQLLNIDQLDDLLKWWIDFSEGELGKKFDVEWMAQVWYPTICNYDILPSDYKNQIANKLEKSLPYFSNFNRIKNYYINQITNLRTETLKVEQKKHFQKAFIRYNDTQDRYRKGNTWRQLLPDLEIALTKSVR